MRVAFLITSPYQVFHYKRIAPHLPDPVAVIEVREQDQGLSEEFVRAHMAECEVEEVSSRHLGSLDGRFAAIVCQTPVLPLEFLRHSKVVAQQYSLAKEQYQYGIWRAHAHLNLMYGDYSAGKVQGFCHAVAVGNPLLDPYWQQSQPTRRSVTGGKGRPRLLYQPTYGELSSLHTVLPQLRDIDADITVKLHHAEQRSEVAPLPEHIRVVGAETDPVALFGEHDGVISDFSGAAFDALYAGLPVVVAGAADPLGKDYHRLSAEERDRALLRPAAATWHPGEDMWDAFAEAERHLDTSARDELLKRTFVNPGTAGEACAAEIVRLVLDGEPHHFAAAQVRTATQRYITALRRSRVRVADGELTEIGAGAPPRPVVRRQSRARLAYRRTRRLLARSDRLRRAARAAKRWRQARRAQRSEVLVNGPLPPPSPAARREAVLAELLPRLRDRGVPVARESDASGSDVAVLGSARRAVLRELHRLGADRPDLQARVGIGADITDTLPLADLRWFDMLSAEWLEVGSVRERSNYRIGYAGFAVLQFVVYDAGRNRYLSARTRATRTDWTGVFAPGGRVAVQEPVPIAPPRPPHPATPVDVVYTWVDSTDPAWREEHERYSGGSERLPSADNAERFLDRQELRYSLRSLRLFAPFVRHIYLVTANQRPVWLDPDHPDVTVVPHREIFPDPSVLPTFNSHAIEACLHRIPGLSEHFLYLNDDVLLGQEVTESDFYTAAGLAKVRMSPSQYIYRGEPEAGAIPTDWAAYHSVRLVEQNFGLTFDRRVMHVPLVLRRDVMREVEDRHPEEIARTRAARFRSRTDVAVPSMLAQFYGIASGRAVEWPTVRNEYVYLDTGRALGLHRLDEILQRRPRFFCLNATRYAEVDLAEQARVLSRFLAGMFPDPAPWELEM